MDLHPPGDGKVGRERVGEDGVRGFQPDDTVADAGGDQAPADCSVRVDGCPEAVGDRAEERHRNGVAEHGDDLGRRPCRRGRSLQGGRDRSRQRQRSIRGDLPSCRVQRFGEGHPQLAEKDTQQEGRALRRLGEPGRGAS